MGYSESSSLDCLQISITRKSPKSGNSMTLGDQITKLIQIKKSNLCISVDLSTTKDVLEILEWIGGQIVIAKLHIDTYDDFTPAFITKLVELKHRHNFLLFEDRKFADIGNTTYKQLHGTFQIAKWADMITIHGLPGEGLIKAVHEANPLLKCLILVEMSTCDNLFTREYSEKCIKLAKAHPEQVLGIISQHKYDGMFTMTPGVALTRGGDNLGQKYRTVEEVIKDGSDVIIVGRAITSHYPNKEEVIRACTEFQIRGYDSRRF
eukprot:NODE_86_length_22163_cov_0.379442.p10 type:complete len:264 gc:universal NODE_86_length_22163_cov_0.379442:4203-4994(+)